MTISRGAALGDWKSCTSIGNKTNLQLHLPTRVPRGPDDRIHFRGEKVFNGKRLGAWTSYTINVELSPWIHLPMPAVPATRTTQRINGLASCMRSFSCCIPNHRSTLWMQNMTVNNPHKNRFWNTVAWEHDYITYVACYLFRACRWHEVTIFFKKLQYILRFSSLLLLILLGAFLLLSL
jgi:hypothetical protein